MRTYYLLLVLLRAYCATVPSYIHPDEHFQGPEIVIGQILGWPTYKTWEFTSTRPIRSTFPLWLVYGPPLTLLKWISEGLGYSEVSPMAVFYVLRILMFLHSFVLADWALHELIPVSRTRTRTHTLTLVASSYVTWTYQSHTFSNSIETTLVLWCIVLMARIRDNAEHTQIRSCIALAFIAVTGIFNRITFPAFLMIPAVQLVPHLFRKPLRIPILLITAAFTALIAMAMDTEYYTGSPLHLRRLTSTAIFTPWNNLAYNIQPENLAQHGLHPYWQHFAANLPQLIGPAFPLLFFSCRRDLAFWTGISGIFLLSCFRHQEPRFLLPAVPLLLSSIRVPQVGRRAWTYTWLAFNAVAAVIFGIYHQGGVIPVQQWIAQQANVAEVIWWKTYSPPRWVLNGKNTNMATTDLMGVSGERMMENVTLAALCESSPSASYLVAPSSATFLDPYTNHAFHPEHRVHFEQVFHHRQHMGLDDLDFADDGIWPTLQRVVGRRGLAVWRVSKQC